MGYIIIFVLTSVAIYFVVFDSKKKKEEVVQEKPKEKKTKEEIEKEELKEFLSLYVYKDKSINLITSQKQTNGFYFEDKNFGVTLFENKNNKTIQIMKIKPYEMIGNIFLKNGSTINAEIKLNEKYEEYKYMIKILVERMNNIELKTINKEYHDSRIKEEVKEIEDIIKKFKEYGEKNKRVEEIEKVELSYYITRYENLKVYELGEGKEKIINELGSIKEELKKMWEEYAEKKRKEYEKTQLMNW